MTNYLSGLRDVDKRRDELDALADLDTLLVYIARCKNAHATLAMARANAASHRIVNTLEKATTEAATASGAGITLGSEFGQLYSQARNIGVADAMFPFAVQMPRYLNRLVLMSSVTSSTVNEGSAKPNRRLALSATDVTPSKGTAMVTATKELLDGVGGAVRAIRQELLRSVVQWTDALLLTSLVGNSSEASGGDTYGGFATDLGEMMQLVGASSQSQLFLVTTPSIAKAIAAQGLASGINQPWSRAELGGVVVIPSDAQDSRRVSLIDASALAMRLGQISVRMSDVAAVELSDTASASSWAPTAASMVSLWQSNSFSVIAEREAAIEPLASNSWAHMTGVEIGLGSASPAGI